MNMKTIEVRSLRTDGVVATFEIKQDDCITTMGMTLIKRVFGINHVEAQDRYYSKGA